MSDNEGFFTLSAEPIEDLGLEDADNEGSDDESPLAPASGGEHTSSSVSDDEEDNTSDEEMEESEEENPDSELSEDEDNDSVYLTANVNKSGVIFIQAANLTAFAKELKLESFPVPVHISNDGRKIITHVDRQIKSTSINGSLGSGVIGNAGLVIKSLGLTKVCSFKMKYIGCSMRSLSKLSYRRDKVYNFQIVNIGAIKKSEPGAAAGWAAEAAKQPLMPAQLTRGVPAYCLMTISGSSNYLRLPAEQYKTFMDQIGQPYKRRVNVLCELESEGCARYYTSFRATEKVGENYFRKGKRFCTISGFGVGDMIRMHYLGYRELSDGRKVHCLRAEKVNTAQKVSLREKASLEVKESLKLPPRLARKRAQDAFAKQFSVRSGAALSPKRQQGPSLNKQATTVTKTTNTVKNIQKPSQLTTPSPAPTSAAPASAARPQHVQQRQQRHQQPHGNVGPSQLRQHVAVQQQEQRGNSMVDLVVKALLHRTDVDRTLVGKYLSLFARLPEITRDIDGSVILRLAAESSIEALQTFLESAV